MQLRSVGVEEELLLVDPASGRPRAVATAVLGDTDPAVTRELQREQVETETRPATSMVELDAQIRQSRRTAAAAARSTGAEVAALATSPLPADPTTSPTPRYQRMVERFGLTAREELTCGCHIHVRVDSDEEAVAVLDRIRVWLPPLLALSANSPFWQGQDSGYASFRAQVWGRWPSAGPTELFGSPQTYRRTVDAMISCDTLLDEGMIYFDARLSRQFPTVEVRVPDVCLQAEDAVLLAALARALVETAAREWRAGRPPAPVRTELLRLASWRAARTGLEEDLLDPLTAAPAVAADVLHRLVGHAAAALDDAGDRELVEEALATVLARRNGAMAQREVHRRTGSLRAVVADAVSRTVPGSG